MQDEKKPDWLTQEEFARLPALVERLNRWFDPDRFRKQMQKYGVPEEVIASDLKVYDSQH